MISIIRGTTKKPISSDQLIDFFKKNNDLDGYLYIGYPIIGTAEGPFPIDAVYLSKQSGMVVFNLVEGRDYEDYEELQDDSYNKMEAKLKNYRTLVEKKKLCVDIQVITFAPLSNVNEIDEEYPLCNAHNLREQLDGLVWDRPEYFEQMVAVLQAISTIRRGKRKRVANVPNSKGAKLKFLEDSIANLDNNQSKAVIETVDGVQRIRGLAGSGKTIVIALKAAYLHAQHPEWKIAVTFNTRSLKGQLKQLINTFVIEQTGEEPDWENLQIIHAWGAPGDSSKNGIYYTFCGMHSLEYFDFSDAQRKYGRDPFHKVCEKAINEMETPISAFDAILVDEAQDFSPFFLQICYSLLDEPKRLVYAYDELQNLGVMSLPSPEEIFGKNEDGSYKVSFIYDKDGKSPQDIILEKCYRNSRPALVTAHALGFGVYRENVENSSGIVQMFEDKQLWKDVGYHVVDGKLEDGMRVVLARDNSSSPEFLESHSTNDDLIQFIRFDSKEQQDKWVAEQIKQNLGEDELQNDDIMVINPNPFSTRVNVSPIRALLFQDNIQTHLAGVTTSPDVFFTQDSVAFTGIYRAKGNEAAMVYVVNAQDCYSSVDKSELATIRNRLFTAITRSKAWVRVLGVGAGMQALIREFEKVKQHNFELEFQYPTKPEREKMNIVNRDMSDAQKNVLRRRQNNMTDLIKGLESGQLFVEDFNEEDLEKLRKLIDMGKKE